MLPVHDPNYLRNQALQYWLQRSMADMAARGINIPNLAGTTPRLPEVPVSAGTNAVAPPFNPPQPVASPIAGRPTQAPVPPVDVSGPGYTTGANQTPQQRTGFGRIAQILSNPTVAAFLQNAGMALGGQRMPGESQMQQITRAIATGHAGVQNEKQLQMQRAMLDWQREQAEREQTRKEQETAGQLSVHQQQTDINREQVRGTLKQGEASIAQRKIEHDATASYNNARLELDKSVASQNWEQARDNINLKVQELDLKKQELADLRAAKADSARINALHEEVLKGQMAVQALQHRVELAKLAQVAGESGDKRMKLIYDQAGRLMVGAQQAFAGLLGSKLGDPKAMQAALDAMDPVKLTEKARASYDALNKPTANTATPQAAAPSTPWTPPKNAQRVRDNKTGKTAYLVNGKYYDENGTEIK